MAEQGDGFAGGSHVRSTGASETHTAHYKHRVHNLINNTDREVPSAPVLRKRKPSGAAVTAQKNKKPSGKALSTSSLPEIKKTPLKRKLSSSQYILHEKVDSETPSKRKRTSLALSKSPNLASNAPSTPTQSPQAMTSKSHHQRMQVDGDDKDNLDKSYVSVIEKDSKGKAGNSAAVRCSRSSVRLTGRAIAIQLNHDGITDGDILPVTSPSKCTPPIVVPIVSLWKGKQPPVGSVSKSSIKDSIVSTGVARKVAGVASANGATARSSSLKGKQPLGTAASVPMSSSTVSKGLDSNYVGKLPSYMKLKIHNMSSEASTGTIGSGKNTHPDQSASAGAVGALKSYPLRNRLRLSGGDPNVPLNLSLRGPQSPSAGACSSSPPAAGGGVTFLTDTFRRLRESRRSSGHFDHSGDSPTKKTPPSNPGKDSRQHNSGSWKRNQRSPASAKKSPRGKATTTGSCASSSQHSSRGCTTKSGLGGIAGATMSAGSLGGGQDASLGTPFVSCSTGAASAEPATTTSATVHVAPSTSTALAAPLASSLGAIGGTGGALAGATGLPGGLGGLMGLPGDSESDESDMSRLEALLASRGLPPSLFGALGPRMQHILHRSVSSSITSKAQQLLVGLQATGDEGEQLQALIEISQLLVMGNEDTLAGFPIKQVTPALINLLSMEHNFDMMNHACRALTYMMEALPRSSAVVVDAVPVFLEKLQVIQCMDVAEQSLTALDMLSRKHSKAILQAHGVSACLTYIDFFGTGAQRASLSVTANCCQNLTADEFHFMADSLVLLSARLTTQGDKKCIESVCLAFSRLVDCFQNDPNRLQEIAAHGLLTHIQQLLVMSPPVLTSGTFIMAVRMLSIMCCNCPELAVQLLKNNIAQTLCFLLTNSTDPPGEQLELVPRSPQELYEITSMIGELLPPLPTDGIFSIDGALQRPIGNTHDVVTWQWQDDRSNWQNYSVSDSRLVELAHQSGEDEIGLCIQGRSYTVDFHSMQQINDNSGTMRTVQRRMTPAGTANPVLAACLSRDARTKCLEEDPELSSSLIRSLFCLLYEVYSSSAGPSVRYKCLRALLRMVNFSSPQLLEQVLKSQSVSSHLATMLSSHDTKIIVGALQMTDILMGKLPEVFSVFFRREGVMHQVKRLCSFELNKAEPPLPAKGNAIGISIGGTKDACPKESPSPLAVTRNCNLLADHQLLATADDSTAATQQLRLTDMLKRKRIANRVSTPVGGALGGGGRWRRAKNEEANALGGGSSSFSDFLMKNTGLGSGRDSWRPGGVGRGKVVANGNAAGVVTTSNATAGVGGTVGKSASSFLANLNPVRWGRCALGGTGSTDLTVTKDKSASISVHNSNHNANREMVRVWIREEAQRLHNEHFSCEVIGSCPHPALNMLNRLIAAIQQLEKEPACAEVALVEMSAIVNESDISPFEVIHSGLVKCLLAYITAPQQEEQTSRTKEADGNANECMTPCFLKVARDQRIRNFLHVFMGCSLDPHSVASVTPDRVELFTALVAKLNGCVNQLEQFPVRVHDLPGASLAGICRGGSTSAIKFFNTHQLKCNLQRHPDCTRLRQWRGGPVKVDPLALVQAIERYLVIRGYGRLRDDDEDNSDDDNSDDDIDDTLAAVSVLQTPSSHKLQFLVGEHPLPYNMTVYQAVRQFSSLETSSGEADADADTPVSLSSIWLQTHTIYYRPIQEEEQTSSGGNRKSKSQRSSPKKKAEQPLCEDGIFGPSTSAITPYLMSSLPPSVTVSDPCLEVLALLRVSHALNRHYGAFFPPGIYPPPLSATEFINAKLTAKANRQLQDPLVIMTGNLPPWLPQIAYACPFLLPFATRQLLFYAVSFDRDRALQRLLDSTPELSAADSSERVTPRLERRKRTVSREDLLKQAEAVMSDLASSRAMLEIQYENEVGTGLGPTLEFYALVSRELQKAELELWRGEVVSVGEGDGGEGQYVNVGHGLYPMPVAKGLKSTQVTKLKSKFRFLGKLLAKAVMDSRMLDIEFHDAFYKYLLGEERSLSLADIASLDPMLGKTVCQLQRVTLLKRQLDDEAQVAIDIGEPAVCQTQERLDQLSVDGCSVEDLGLTFSLPGYVHVELKKGGAEIPVTLDNLEAYVQLLVNWLLRDSVWRQMEALREGFESVFPLAQLQVFYSEELQQLFCGSGDSCHWDVKQLAECCRPDHGYTRNSGAVQMLLQVLAEYNPEQQRSFLQFVTGSPRLPVGGFRSLSPALTIVRKTFEAGENPDDFLPSVMTCVNYLKLPDYSSIEIMRVKLDLAAREGQHSFHLS